MPVIFSLLLLIIGLIIFFYKNGAYFIYFLYIWILFCPLIYSLVFYLDITDFWTICTWCNRYELLIFLIVIFSKKRNLNIQKKVLIVYIIFIIYYFFISLIRGVGILDSIKYSYGCYLCFVCLPIIFSIETNCRKLIFFLNLLLWIELSVGLLQYFFPELNYKSYFTHCPEDLQPLSGTLYGNNTYIEFVLFLWYCLTYQYCKNKAYGYSQLVQTLLFIYLLFVSGVRVAIIAAVPLFYYLFNNFYIKRNKKIVKKRLLITIFGAVSIGLFLVSYFSNLGVTYTVNATSGLERNAVLASIFMDNSFLIQHTTFGLSYDVIKHLPENIIFGPGLLFINKGYDGYINMEAGNITDATLAIYICETGLIGLLFLFYFLSFMIKSYCKGDKSILYFLISLLILTITDSGIFSPINLLILFTMVYLNNQNNKDNEYYKGRFKTLQESYF